MGKVLGYTIVTWPKRGHNWHESKVLGLTPTEAINKFGRKKYKRMRRSYRALVISLRGPLGVPIQRKR